MQTQTFQNMIFRMEIEKTGSDWTNFSVTLIGRRDVTEMTKIFLEECESNVKKIFKRKYGKTNVFMDPNIESTPAPVSRRSASCIRAFGQTDQSFTELTKPWQATSCPPTTRTSSQSSSWSSSSPSFLSFSPGPPKFLSKNHIPHNVKFSLDESYGQLIEFSRPTQ